MLVNSLKSSNDQPSFSIKFNLLLRNTHSRSCYRLRLLQTRFCGGIVQCPGSRKPMVSCCCCCSAGLVLCDDLGGGVGGWVSE